MVSGHDLNRASQRTTPKSVWIGFSTFLVDSIVYSSMHWLQWQCKERKGNVRCRAGSNCSAQSEASKSPILNSVNRWSLWKTFRAKLFRIWRWERSLPQKNKLVNRWRSKSKLNSEIGQQPLRGRLLQEHSQCLRSWIRWPCHRSHSNLATETLSWFAHKS